MADLALSPRVTDALLGADNPARVTSRRSR